jgi:two-component system OmpR family sensor kinase
MDGFQERLRLSLQWRLSWWLAVAMLLVAALAAAVSYLTALDEANEMQDQTLRQIGALYGADRLPVAGAIQFIGDDEAPVMLLGLRRTSAAGLAALPDGMHRASMNGVACRVLLRTVSPGLRLAVGQAIAFRDEIANHSALRTLLPLLLLVPLLPLLVVLLVRRLFLPVAVLAREADQRSEHELQALAPDFLPLELRPFVVAINRLLARVEKSMHQQRRFVADAAHELRSPLTALSLQAEALAVTALPAAATERIEALHLGIERSRVLLDQMLALARAQTILPRTAAPVPVLDIFRRVLEDLMPLAEARQIDIGVEAADDPRISGDPVDLLMLVKNLADNAIRYSPAGGKVDLCTHADGGQVVIEVCDRGPGIAPAQRERVFDPFFRVLGSEQSGSGLGLSIVAEIARRMGATVRLDWTDAAQMQGLRVSVRFQD